MGSIEALHTVQKHKKGGADLKIQGKWLKIQLE